MTLSKEGSKTSGAIVCSFILHIRKAGDIQAEKDFKIFHMQSQVIHTIALVTVQAVGFFFLLIITGRWPDLQGAIDASTEIA